MENPYEKQQTALLSRIVTKVATLNSSITDLNERLEALKNENEDVVSIGQMWVSFINSTEIHLENTKNTKTPPRMP